MSENEGELMEKAKPLNFIFYFFDILLKIIVYLMGMNTIYKFKACDLAIKICANRATNFLCMLTDEHVALLFTVGFIATIFLNENKIVGVWQKIIIIFKRIKGFKLDDLIKLFKRKDLVVLKYCSLSTVLIIFLIDHIANLTTSIFEIGIDGVAFVFFFAFICAIVFYIIDYEASGFKINESLEKLGCGMQLIVIVLFLIVTFFLSKVIYGFWHFLIAAIIYILARLIISTAWDH